MSLFDRLRRIVRAQGGALRPDGEAPRRPRATPPPPPRRPAPEQELPPEVRRAYRVLELEPGADLAAVKRAYRRQQQRYHQDRFAGDPVKEQKARRVSTELNLAYERLQQHLRSAA